MKVKAKQLKLAILLSLASSCLPILGHYDVVYAGTHTLSGAQTSEQTISDTAPSVTIDSAYSGTSAGVSVTNTGSGDTTVSSAGSFSGSSSYDDIYAYDVSGAGNLNVIQTAGSIGNITSGISGIYTVNLGTGSTNITQSGGTIIGAAGDGIYATNGIGIPAGTGNITNNATAGTDLNITADGTVSGTQNGISAYNSGKGNTTITVDGSVTGAGTSSSNLTPGINTIGSQITEAATGYGVYAWNNTSAKNMTVTQNGGTISGITGIQAYNNGAGGNTVVAQNAGSISGGTGYGIYAYNDGNAADLTVTQAAGSSMTAGTGISVANHTNAATNTTLVDVAGNITATTGDGIGDMNHSGNVTLTQEAGSTINAYNTGIWAWQNTWDNGTININAAGTINATSSTPAWTWQNPASWSYFCSTSDPGTGIGYYGSSHGGAITPLNITVASTGVINAAIAGIGLFQGGFGDVNIVNNGTITVTPAAAGDATAGGIVAYNTNHWTNMTQAIANNSISITNNGTVTSQNSDAVKAWVQDGGALTVNNSGTLSGTIGISGENNGLTDLSVTQPGGTITGCTSQQKLDTK